jgi:molybdenum cofactor cytidylyltransferase
MGALNKLLAEIDGTAMVRGVVETVLASKARPVVVVTGHQAGEVRAALAGLDVRFVHNPDYEQGLSTSLRHGIGALDEALDGAVDGALVCLGDMPQVSAGHLDKVIAAFDPDEGRAICVPTSDGKRGNPVLWGAQFFAEIGAVSGDVGARHLIGEYAEMVCEVELGDGAVLVDIDTPEALGDLRAAGSA